MPRSSPSSGASDAEREGGALVAASVAALATLLLANLAPPERAWWPALLAAGAAAAACGLRRAPGGRAWWALAGVCAGALAGALAPRAPFPGARTVPVRALIAVRDGWQAGALGWSTRVRLEEVTRGGEPLRCSREVWLTLPADVRAPALPAPGSRWETAGELAYRARWPLRRPQLRVKSERLLRPLPGGDPVDLLREGGMRSLERAAGTDPELLRAAGLAAALVLGRTEAVASGEVDSLRRSGLAHLLAVSGLNVGLVGSFVVAVLLVAGVPPGRRRWAVAMAMLAFAALAGSGAPVRRAAFAGAAYLAARQLGRPLLAIPVVWGVVAGIALLEPDAVLQAGFQLSALVTLALVRWVEPLAGRLGLLPRWTALALAVAVIGQLASAPLVGHHFGNLSLLGVAANLAAAPVAFALTVLALAALGAAALAPWLGHVALAAIVPFQAALDGISATSSVGVLEVPPLSGPVLVAVAAAGLAGLARRRAAAAAAGLAIALWAAWAAVPAWPAVSGGEVRMLPVSEGMALLVRGRDGAVLVDAGRSPSGAARALAALRVRRLAALVITHPDADHVGGARRVLDRLRVGELVFPALVANQPEVVALRRAAQARGVRALPVTAGMRVTLAGTPCDVLWPAGAAITGAANDASLVVRLHLAGVRVLVTGDLERGGEALLEARPGGLRAEVLQLPHHGSATSSGPSFLHAVAPRLALAASGTAPRYPYPAREVLERVRRAGAAALAQREGAAVVAWERGGDVATLDGAVRLRLAGARERR